MAGFTAELAERVNSEFADLGNAEHTEIFNFTKEIALESFKNGLKAPKRQNAPYKRGAGQAVQLGVE